MSAHKYLKSCFLEMLGKESKILIGVRNEASFLPSDKLWDLAFDALIAMVDEDN